MLSWVYSYTSTPLGFISPLVEILIITSFIYAIISFLHDTRGGGVRVMSIIGGCLLLLTFIAAQLFDLENVSWMIENLSNIILVGMVVIFQPEIRHSLVRLGESVKLWNSKASSLDKEVADAATQIALKGAVGGMIAFERAVRIDSYIESGIQIDAICTAPLLRTIFTKNTPLHDGAVIIRQGRIVAANCLLPLSENVEITRGMGTRHRAAIGLAEESDAVTVVISEETGQISVTMQGEIIRNVDYERLREIIRRSVFQINESEKDDLAVSPS
ncbi:MAG: diadenylate cyclase [Planctomycetota bacterium]|jgi:diadenylate cyclase|nr:diadenylate cyclase [Planctomycetota bacterium]